MKISWSVLFNILIFVHYCHGQINLRTIDTSLWDLDTCDGSTLIVTPKFVMNSDTSFVFYDVIKQNKVKVLSVAYVHKYRSLFGSFSGNEQYVNSNTYISIKPASASMDSSMLMSIIDTILYYRSSRYYCIRVRNINIRDSVLLHKVQTNLNNIDNEHLIIANQDLSKPFPDEYVYLFAYIKWEEPPYMIYDWFGLKPITK